MISIVGMVALPPVDAPDRILEQARQLTRPPSGAPDGRPSGGGSCACGHGRDAHEHFRVGSECSMCRSAQRRCLRFHRDGAAGTNGESTA
jgi:hypothetical protein